jgi:hypothetical protein
LIAKREEAKKARQENIENSNQSNLVSVNGDVELDEYDRVFKNLEWPSGTSASPSNQFNSLSNKSKLLSLQDLCMETLVLNFNLIRHQVDALSYDMKNSLLSDLSKVMLITDEVASLMTTKSCRSLFIPQCSNISEEMLIQLLEKTSTVKLDSNSAFTQLQKPKSKTKQLDDIDEDIVFEHEHMQTIQLVNTGHSFTDRVAAFLLNRVQTLESLEITGCYKLTDESLSRLLTACRDSLLHLNLSTNSRVGVKSLKALNLTVLKSLTLDNCVHLTDEDLSCILPDSEHELKSSSSLTALSLNGLEMITDSLMVNVLKRYGGNLQSLSIGRCLSLSDKSLVAIRCYCANLKELNLSGLMSITTPSLIGLFLLHPDYQKGNSEVRDNKHALCEMDNLDTMNHKRMKVENIDMGVTGLMDGDDDIDADGSTFMEMDMDEDMVLKAIESYSIGQLVKVDLSDINCVTDDVILHLALTSSHTLSDLNVHGCYQMTSRSLVILTKLCSDSLTKVNLSFIRRVSEDALGYFIDNLANPDFDELIIWGCSQITNRLFQNIRQNCIRIIGFMAN